MHKFDDKIKTKTKQLHLVAMAMRMQEQQVDNALVQSNRNRIQMERVAFHRRLSAQTSMVGPFV